MTLSRETTPWHALRPFGTPAGAERTVEAWAAVQRTPGESPQLRLRYRLQPWAGLRLPARSPNPSRRDGLWQHTCLEAFVAVSDQDPYWEFNLAPSGDWAVYRLSSYRQDLQEEAFYEALPVAVTVADASALTLELSCPLPPELAGASSLQLGLTAVLESQDDSLSYWAMDHPGPEADFHDRRGWLISLCLDPAG